MAPIATIDCRRWFSGVVVWQLRSLLVTLMIAVVLTAAYAFVQPAEA